MREGAENGDPKHLRDVEALGNICAMIDRGVLLFVDEGVIEKEYNFRESEHYFGFLRVCVCVMCGKVSKKKKRNKKLRAEQLSFLLSLSLSACCMFLLLLLLVVVLLLRP